MFIRYKTVRKAQPGVSGGGKRKWYAAPARRSKLRNHEVAMRVEHQSALSAGDVIHAIYALREAILYGLLNGDTVHLEGLGTFSLSFKSEGVEHREDFRHHHIKDVLIQFRPDITMADAVRRAPRQRMK